VTGAILVVGDGPAADAIARRLGAGGAVERLHVDGAPADPASAAAEAAAAIARVGAPAVAVAAFARRDPGRFLDVDGAAWEAAVDRELTAPFLVTREAARAARAAGQSAVVVHVIERADGPGAGAAVTEQACRLMVAATALDLLPDGVRVCGVSGAAAPAADGAYAETVAEAVAFCASAAASYVVGSTYDPWGGREARWP
jgi:NAD(P)-dependent dehydrogenase (short-subunit alcohol dehydrogenase family)